MSDVIVKYNHRNEYSEMIEWLYSNIKDWKWGHGEWEAFSSGYQLQWVFHFHNEEDKVKFILKWL